MGGSVERTPGINHAIRRFPDGWRRKGAPIPATIIVNVVLAVSQIDRCEEELAFGLEPFWNRDLVALSMSGPEVAPRCPR